MKRIKIGGLFVLVIGLVGFAVYNYIMHGGARDLSTENTDFTVSSKSIMDEFTKSTPLANTKYLEKAVAISGNITAVNGTEISIDHSIICTLKTPDTSIKKDQSLEIKGRVVGYDDLMGELKLDQCLVIKN
jgi:hypothetical protein